MHQTSFYQIIVLGLGFLLLFGAGYLITSTDQSGVLRSMFAKTETASSTDASATSTPAVDVTGTYVCDTDSGCKDPVTLTVNEGGDLAMTTSYAEGAEVLGEVGTWKTAKDGSFTATVTGTASDSYPIPHSFAARYASGSSLSGITFDAKIFKDWTIPVFRKQEGN